MSPLFCPMMFLGGGTPAFPATPFAWIVRATESPQTNTLRYSFNAEVVAAGATLAQDLYSSGAAGNTTYGIVGGTQVAGYNTVFKYTYATYVVSAGGNFTTSQVGYVSAAGNSTRGIWSSYYNSSTSTSTATTQKYLYANSTFATGGSFSVIQLRTGAISNATYGAYLGGMSSGFVYIKTSQRYTFSSDTSAASALLSVATSEDTGGGGNTTFGIVGGGRNSTVGDTAVTNKYSWSAFTISGGTALSGGGPGAAGAGDSTKCYWFGGYGGVSTTRCDRYTFSGDVRSSGTALSVSGGTIDGSAVSSTPGGW